MRTFLLFVGMISCTVVANLLLKTGAVAVSGEGLQRLLNWRLWLGMTAFGLAAAIYIVILRKLPLNVAQSFTAAQFVAVILASSWVLAEPIKPFQWFGIAFIAVGIVIVGWTR